MSTSNDSDQESPGINQWSFSRLSFYKNCPYAAKLKYVDRRPELERPAPVRGKEHANDRGSRIHSAAEEYINGDRDDLIYELTHFEDELEACRIMKSQHPDRVLAEELWLFDQNWVPTEDQNKIWLRVIADLQVWSHDRKHMWLVDIKTGKRDRNEVKHGQQLQLYQLAAFMRYPELETVTASLWYIDQNLRIDTPFTRERGLKYFPIWNNQAQYMCQDREFKAKPSEYRCRFCPYGGQDNKWVKKTGDCEFGI